MMAAVLGSLYPSVSPEPARDTFVIFSPYAVSGAWDIDNPEKILLPSSDPNEYYDVKCMAGVGDRIWVGVGPSIFFLDAETHSREVWVFDCSMHM